MARGKRSACGLGPIVVMDEKDERMVRRLKRRCIANNYSRNVAPATGIAEARAGRSTGPGGNFVVIDDDDDDGDDGVCDANSMGFSDGSVVDDAEYVAFLDSLVLGQCGDSDAYYDYRGNIGGSLVNKGADGLVGSIPVNGGATNIYGDYGVVSVEVVDDCTPNYKSMHGGFFDGVHVEVVGNVGPATVNRDGSGVRSAAGGGSYANVDALNSGHMDNCIVDESVEDGCGGGCDNNGGFSDVDPCYKMFLDNLRVDGNTYVAEFPLSDGISALIRYETDEPHAACGRLGNLETDKDCSQSDSVKERIDIGAKSRNVRATERKSSAVAKDRQKKLADRVSRGANGHTGKCPSPEVLCQNTGRIRSDAKSHLADEDYNIYLNSLLKAGGDQLLMPKKGTGSIRGRKRTWSSSQRKSVEIQTKSRDVGVKEEMIAVVKRKVQTKAADRAPFRASGDTSEIPSLDALASANSNRKCVPKFDMVNLGDQGIDKSLNRDGTTGVLKPESGTAVTYRSDDNSSSDLKVLESDVDPFCGEYNSPFVTSKAFESLIHDEDGVECKASCSDRRCALFRKRLIEYMKRPYDENECKELYNKVRCRKPLECERRLRSSIKQYASASLGKSYLDHHSDFAKEIHSANENPLKLLSLLRGFFFWLQNLTQEGQFKPWLDSQCLQVLPLRC